MQGFRFFQRGRILMRFLPVFLLCLAAQTAGAADTKAIDRALAHPNLRGAQVGVEVYSITQEKVIYASGSRVPLTLASNSKIITTASALHHLGAEAQPETGLYAIGRVEEGVLHGDLAVRGCGDPGLSARFHPDDPLKPLEDLAAAAAAAGIRRVSGNLVLDDTAFDREFVSPGWPEDQLCYYYCAPVAGLAVLENLVGVEVQPASSAGHAAALLLQPADAPYRLSGEVMTTSRKGENLVHLARPGPDGVLQVSGKTWSGNPPGTFHVTVRDPVRYFGGLMAGALARAGIRVEGAVKPAERPLDYEAGDCACLGKVTSSLLEEVIITNKESQNHFAEQLFKMTGWKVEGKGTFATGALAAGRMFENLEIEDIDPFFMQDGSGLSRENRFSSHTIVSLLAALYNSPLRDPFIRSLPIAGLDGSLEDRLTEEPYRSRVRGKTGWIREVSALSGFVQSLSGEVFAFSILFNGYKGSNAVMKSVQDDICRALVND